MNNTNTAADLLNLLALLTVIAGASDREDAEDTAVFFWRGAQGTRLHLPDGRTLIRL